MHILWTGSVKYLKPALKNTEIKTDENVLAISWNIATEPKLYRELAPNPYSQKALQIISGRFPHVSTADVIRAVVLAEPEGKYDRDFNLFPKSQQEEELYNQKTTSTEINERLVQYCKKYAKELSLLSKEHAYDRLSRVVFETADLKKIEKRYTQNQRRGFRLSIINFIEDDYSSAAFVPSNEKPTHGRQLLTVAFATLIFILFFNVANGLHLLNLFITPTQSITQYVEVKNQVLAIETQKENHRFPVRLKIPSIKIDAAIEYVGLTSEGSMEVPSSSVDVGWFALGSRPGEKGSAVIAGHFDGENGKTGVFTNLNKLKEGDILYVEDSKGTTITFVVRKSRIYDPGYADDVFAPSDRAHLNLITCDGVWDGAEKSYSKRLVVFADIID